MPENMPEDQAVKQLDNPAVRPLNHNNSNKKKHKRPYPDNYTPSGAPELLNKPIEELDLRENTLTVLKKGNVNKVSDLIRFRERELYRIQNFNKKNLLDVDAKVKALGLSFRPDDQERRQERATATQQGENRPERNSRPINEPRRDNRPLEQQNMRREGRDNRPPERTPIAPDDRSNRIRVTASGRIIESGRRDDRRDGSDRRNGGRDDRREDRRDDRRGERRDDRRDDRREDFRDAVRPERRDNRNLEGTDSISKKLDSRPTPLKEEKLPPDALIKFVKDGKCGFKDLKGKIIIPPVYDEAFSFKENLACVEEQEKFGYIDRTNSVVIPIQYDLAMSFSEGLACVSIGEKCGYIDPEGNIVIDIKYEAGTAFQDGSARVKLEGKWGSIEKDGKFKTI